MKIDSDLFQVFSFTKAKKEKSKNGDFVLSQYLQDEQLVVLILSDGVSTCSADWLASELTCKTSFEHFLNYNKMNIKERIYQSILDANRVLCNNIEDLMATLIFIVWDIQSNKIYYVDIGDSKLFRANINSITQLSEDDIQRAPARSKNGYMKVMDAIRYTNELTKVIGINTELHFDIKDIKFNDDEIFILCSDGVYDDGIFPLSLRTIVGKANCEKELEDFIFESSRVNQDDASMILLRKKIYGTELKKRLNEIVELSPSKLNIFEYIISNLSLEIIIEDIKTKNLKHLDVLIFFLLKNNIYLNKDKLVELFDQIIKIDIENIKIVNGFRMLIQKSF